MPTILQAAPIEYKSEGTWVTQSTEARTGQVTVKVTLIMTDEDILTTNPLRKLTRLVLQATTDDGLSWKSVGAIGNWASGPQNAPRNPGDPVSSPGLSRTIPADGFTRKFRVETDFPQPLFAGVQIELS